MISWLTKTLLVFTSLAPILFTYWFVEQVEYYDEGASLWTNLKCSWSYSGTLLLSALVLLGVCIFLIEYTKKNLEQLPVSVCEIKTADNESLAFILVYLLPLAGQVTDSLSIPVLIFISILFFFTVATSHSYHFNPLLSFIGYHFYEVKLDSGITYILLSRKSLTNCRNIKHVGHLTEYMIIEK